MIYSEFYSLANFASLHSRNYRRKWEIGIATSATNELIICPPRVASRFRALDKIEKHFGGPEIIEQNYMQNSGNEIETDEIKERNFWQMNLQFIVYNLEF